MRKLDQTALKRKREQSHSIGEPDNHWKRPMDRDGLGEGDPVLATDDLLALLDLSSLTSHVLVDSRFQRIAAVLLQDYHLVCLSPTEQFTFEILEIEFYLIKPGVHEDPFTHGNEEQKESGRWYFHRAPRRSNDLSSSGTPQRVTSTAAGGYRGGTRKGLDLTFGGRVSLSSRHFFPQSLGTHFESATSTAIFDPPRGGILLRSVRRISDGAVISGPSLLADEILRLSGAASIADLVVHKWNGDTAALHAIPGASEPRTSLSLQRRRSSTGSSARGSQPPSHLKPPMYRSPRIGLDLLNRDIPTDVESALKHPRVVFVSKPYRYFTNPRLLTANGRGQTFLGVYLDDMSPGNSHAAAVQTSPDEIAEMTGFKKCTVEKYIEDYLQGYRSGSLKRFIGAAGKRPSSSPSSFLTMMASLRKAREV